MVDLEGDAAALGVDRVGEPSQLGYHAVAVDRGHLLVAAPLARDVGVAGDDQPDSGPGESGVLAGDGRAGDSLSVGEPLGRRRPNESVWEGKCADPTRVEERIESSMLLSC